MTPAQKDFYNALQFLQVLKEVQNTRDSDLLSQLWEVAWNEMIAKGKLWLAETQKSE
jgi:hypothetical protein